MSPTGKPARPEPLRRTSATPATVAETWAEAVRRHGPSRAVWTEDVVVTYAELDAWSVHVAHRLHVKGVATGSLVVTALENSARHIALMIALSRLGAVLVPVDPTQTDGEIADLVVRCRAAHVVVPESRRPALLDAGVRAPVLDADAVTARPAATAMAPELPDVSLSGDDPWAVFYTSGSTSKPRGAVVPQRTFAVTGQALADAAGFTGNDVVLSVLPMHHLSVSVMSFAPAVVNGLPFALARRFSRSGFFDVVRASGATVTTTVPTIVEMLLTRPPEPADRDHTLRLVVTHRRIEAFERRFGARVAALWGMTETGGLGCVQRPGDDRPETVGRPYPPDAEVRLVDAGGGDIAAGRVGELWFRHPAVMLGYLDEDPPPEGWIRSGDLFTRLGDGSYRYVGRSKNMIKRGGENIALEEIERVLSEHPSVEEVVVVGVDDPIYVEEACAVVVWRGAPRVEDLRRFCRERLAPWKEPRYVAAWPGYLPELTNHKIDRNAVKEGLRLAEADDRLARG